MQLFTEQHAEELTALLAAHTVQLPVKKQLGLNTKVKTERRHKFGVAPLFVFVANKPAEREGFPFLVLANRRAMLFLLPGQCSFRAVVVSA